MRPAQVRTPAASNAGPRRHRWMDAVLDSAAKDHAGPPEA